MALTDLANPTRFLALVARALPWLAAATALAMTAALWLAMIAPADYQQGGTVVARLRASDGGSMNGAVTKSGAALSMSR